MRSWDIIILGLWIYPIVTYLAIRLTKEKLIFRKNIFICSGAIIGLTILGLTFNFSTTFSDIDWICISSFYFFLLLILWWTQFQLIKPIKYIGLVSLFGVLTIGYISGTIGILGVGFIVGEFTPEIDKQIDKNIIYKELTLGNALSDHRGKKVEIYKSFTWIPFEWRIQSKTYNDYATYGQPLKLNYDSNSKTLILRSNKKRRDSIYHWSDTIKINN